MQEKLFSLLIKIRAMGSTNAIKIHFFITRAENPENYLKCKPITPNIMLYGTLGIFPIDIQIKSRMLNFWSNIASKHVKISCLFNRSDTVHSGWLTSIYSMLNDLGLSQFWYSQH
ncbi:hypothetical protein MAR_016346, partial [Mya arenaria]